MQYVIYARKSTEDREDRQVLSIDSQIEEIQRKFPDLNIVEIIRESKSAYKPYNRPEFQRMVEMFQAGKVQGLLAWHPDRLSREPISGGMVVHLLDNGFIKDLKFVSYNFDNSPEGKMMLALVLSQSKYFSEKLGVDAKRGMLKKCKMGQMPARPPIGYMPDRMMEKGAKRHIKDPERFNLVRKLWNLMLTGQYSIMGILRAAKKMSLTTRPAKNTPAKMLCKTTIYQMFSNLYYTGQFMWDGELYHGDHPPMITMAEFEHVQLLIGNKHIPRPKKYESFISGLIKCTCGACIVLERKKKLLKLKGIFEVYDYARCSRNKKGQQCAEPPLRLSDVEQQAVSYLKSIKISDAFHKWAMKNLQQVQAQEEQHRSLELQSLRRGHDECQKKLDNLLALKISPANADGSLLDDEEFKLKRAELTKERDRLASMIQQIDYRADKWTSLVQGVFDTARNAQTEFEKGDIQKKKLILSTIGANFVLTNRQLHIEAKRPYIVFAQKAPEARRLEERGELEKSRYGKPKTETVRQLFSLWGGLTELNR